MKKRTLTVLCLLLAASVLTGCSEEKEPYVQKSCTPEEQISAICIDVRDRQVEVAPSADGQIHIDYAENSKEYYEISVSEDRVLTMTAANDKEWEDYVGEKVEAESRKITLQVPDALLEDLKISTTNEDISIAPLTLVGGVSLNANGGDVSFEALEAGGNITLDVKNGDISGTISGSYDDYAISCTIKKGESNLPFGKTGGSKTLAVTANNGDVDIEIVPAHSA